MNTKNKKIGLAEKLAVDALKMADHGYELANKLWPIEPLLNLDKEDVVYYKKYANATVNDIYSELDTIINKLNEIIEHINKLNSLER